MKLVFQKKHLSITALELTELPAFTVLTGVNGSGKSHLLEAINLKAIKVADKENPRIVLFNYENFRLDNESSFTAHQLAADREAAWGFHQGNVKANSVKWRGKLGDKYTVLKNYCEASQLPFLKTADPEVLDYRQQVRTFLTNNHKGNAHALGIYSLAQKIPYAIDDIDHDEFVGLYKPFGYKNDFLPNQLGGVFWDYYVKYRQNQLNEFEHYKHNKNYQFFTEEEFIIRNGRKPWDLVNEILRQFDSISYQVNSPEGSDIFANFQLKLKHTERPDVEIQFSSLSSGEKILMALVASVYKSSGDQNFPDILLLDEVDASLHPSMMRNMLDVVKNVFLSQGVEVILVTHSPTTIALAPEDSLYIMNREGSKRVEKTSRQDALAILTQGFATIDEGLRLFDDVARNQLTIITEGHNVSFLKKSLELNNIQNVDVMAGLEGITGKTQLKTLFDFFSKAPHENKVLFVWDCDVTYQLNECNNTYPFIFAVNEANKIAKKGIENLFDEKVFEGFKTRVIKSNEDVLEDFDGTRKRDFEMMIMNRSNGADFHNFSPFVEKVRKLCGA